jgi:hypothetical protein
MKKRIFALLMMLLILISLNALADSVPYTFGDFTIPVPDNLYVLTKDKHDVAALGLEVNISQYFADSLFESQPGLLIDCMRIDPFYEISVSQQPVTEITDFSEAAPGQLEEYWNFFKNDMQARQLDLKEKVQIVSHPQTNFLYYTGITDRDGTTVDIAAYVTCENGIMTTIALNTYDGPADESMLALLDGIVQDTVLNIK